MSKFVRLIDLCIRITDGSHYSPVGVNDGYPMFSVKDMRDNGFSYEDCKYISENEFKKMVESGCKPEINDILIAKDGSYLKHVFVITEDKNEAVLSSIGILKPDVNKVNPYYIKYYLSSNFVKREVSKKYVSGSALPRIILKNFANIEIPYISMDEQNRIVKILKVIDDKIEINNRINKELETMAKAIYDYWFLQFDFPNEEGKPYKSSGGKMVWDEELKKEIPDGWKVEKIESLCSLRNGINYDKNDMGDKNYKIVNVRNITASTLILDEFECDSITLNSLQADKYIIDKDDILIARSGTPGAVRILLECSKQTIFCGFIICCTPRKKNQRLYLTYCLKALEGSGATKTGGSIMQNVSQDTLKNINVCVPSSDVIEAYNNKIETILNKIQNNIQENQQLTSLRDFLLPLLMNGQVGF